MSSVISAEITSSNIQVLHDVIMMHNMLSPCGTFKSSSICMGHGVCSNQFPKQDVEGTGHDDSQEYVTYKRRTTQNRGERAPWAYRLPSLPPRTRRIANVRVVPFGPELSMMFQCRQNVKLCICRVGTNKHQLERCTVLHCYGTGTSLIVLN